MVPKQTLPWWATREFLFGLGAVLLSFVLLPLAFQDISNELALFRSGVTTDAKVVASYVTNDLYWDWHDGLNRYRRLRVSFEYKSKDGQTHGQTVEMPLLMIDAYPVGKVVQARYLSSDPRIMELRHHEMSDRGFILGCIGALALVCGIGLMVLARMGLASGLI